MSKVILQKCLDELSKESPKLDYVRGMLEVLIEQDNKPQPIAPMPVAGFVPTVPNNPSVNPHGLPDSPGFDVLTGKNIKNG